MHVIIEAHIRIVRHVLWGNLWKWPLLLLRHFLGQFLMSQKRYCSLWNFRFVVVASQFGAGFWWRTGTFFMPGNSSLNVGIVFAH